MIYAPFRLDEKWQSRWLPDQIGFGVGYSGVYDTREQGHGVAARFVLPSPKLNLQLSLNVGMRYYFNDEVEGWADFETIRLEWGMHLMNVFVGGGHDHYARLKSHEHRAGVLDGYVFEAGVSFALPLSRWSWNKWPPVPKRY
jgi:hypothetical protein